MRPRTAIIDGNRIVYRLAGKGPVLMFVHGMAGSSETWRYVLPVLAEDFTVVALDLLGQGESDKPAGDYSLAVHVSTVRDLMDVLGYDRATLVGQSHGGGIAMQLAYRHPQRCERLVLVDSGGFGREVTFYLRLLSVPGFESVFRPFCNPLLRGAGNQIATWLQRAGVKSTPARQEIWRSYASLAEANNRRAFFRSLREIVDFRGQTMSALARMRHLAAIPTLIVWGAQDPFIPVSHAIAAHDALPGSRLEIFEDVGHYPHCEDPGRFVALLVDFIKSTTPAQLTARNREHLGDRPPPGNDHAL